MKRISLYSLIKDIETIAPKPINTKEPEEIDLISHRSETETVPRRGSQGKRRRIKK